MKVSHTFKILAFCMVTLGGAIPSWGVPLDNTMSMPRIELSGKFATKYDLSEDANDPHLFYIAPTGGRLVDNNGMPALSYATALREDQKFGVLNAIFSFRIPPEDFDAIRAEIKTQDPDARLRPLPFTQTTPEIALAGFGDSEGACFTATDFITGQEVTQCIDLVYRSKIAARGPTLGEELAISMVVSPAGVDILPHLLRGGAGLVVKLDGLYRAALPAFKATILADYKKLYMSFAAFLGYSGGICSDLGLSAFFEKEIACAANNVNANGNACSIKVTYTDSLGRKFNNVFAAIPSGDEPSEVQAWYKENHDRVDILWTAIDGLRTDFEAKFLQPIVGRKAEVDKKAAKGFTFRADSSVSESVGTYEFERDMLQSVGPKLKTMVGYTICLDINGETGEVKNYLGGNCKRFHSGQNSPEDMLPVVDEFNSSGNLAKPMVGSLAWDNR